MENNFTYKAIGIDVTEALESYIDKRMTPLVKKYSFIQKPMSIEIGKTTEHHKHGEIFFAESKINLKEKTVFARTEGNDLYATIDDLQTELYTQLDTIKGKKFELFKRGARKIKKLLRFEI